MVVFSLSVQVLKFKDKKRLGAVDFFYHSMQWLYSVDEKMFKFSNLRRKTKRTLYRVKLENRINI